MQRLKRARNHTVPSTTAEKSPPGAGCRVVDGSIKRDAEVRLMRDGEQVFKGKLSSLKRFKDDAREVTNGMECGMGIANFNDIQVGDTVEAFVTERVAAELTAQ